MIIDVAHTKGGVGKSTIATNLAIEMDADLLDLDIQNSSIGFSRLGPKRANNFIRGQVQQQSDLNFLSAYKGTKDKHLIVDSGGYDSAIVRQLIIASDLIITPVAVSQVELMGLQNFDKVIRAAEQVSSNINAYVLFNRVTRFQKNDLELFENYIRKDITDYKILKTQIGDRKAYKDAFAAGLSVCELNNKSLAADEIRRLILEINDLLKT